MPHKPEGDCQLFNNLTFWLNRLATQMRESANEAFREHDITWPQWMVLNLLHSQVAATPAEIADTLGIDRSAATRLLDRLEEKAHVERVHDRGDRRRVNIGLTASGRALMESLNHLADRQQEDFLSHLPATELRVFKSHVQKLLRAGGVESRHLWRQI